jgi:hypothetical protein
MVFMSLPEITRWDNPYLRLLGAFGLSPSHGGGLRAPFLLRFRREEGKCSESWGNAKDYRTQN